MTVKPSWTIPNSNLLLGNDSDDNGDGWMGCDDEFLKKNIYVLLQLVRQQGIVHVAGNFIER